MKSDTFDNTYFGEGDFDPKVKNWQDFFNSVKHCSWCGKDEGFSEVIIRPLRKSGSSHVEGCISSALCNSCKTRSMRSPTSELEQDLKVIKNLR